MQDLLQPSTHIVIILHGYTCKVASYFSIQKVIKKNYPLAKVLIPRLPMTTYSMADPNNIVLQALQLVDSEWLAATNMNRLHTHLPKIIIIGHSTGALLARKLYICACGENSDAPFEKTYTTSAPKPWAAYVERIILLAGMNRGWTLNRHLYNFQAFQIRVGILAGRILQTLGFRPLAFKTRRGAPFITQLRLQWLSMLRHAKPKKLGDTMVIQLLGTVDDLISPEDNIDLVTGGNFIYLDVPMSGHIDILDLEDKKSGPQRAAVFVKALTASDQILQKEQIIPADQFLNAVDEQVTDVVFVIHGIRDTGYWTQKVARRVKALGDAAGKKFAMETSTYGYFPMLHFLMFSRRKAKVEWLMDQYTENLALYPNAQFSFIGHSHGTYLLAKALKDYPACKFKNVLFAGSVVEQSYDWKALLSTKRIDHIYNLVATSDWVVACFPKTFQRLRFQDLGSAGFDGFASLDDSCQFKYIPGNHSAAIKEQYWNDIANFIVHGQFTKSTNNISKQPRSWFMKLLGATAPIPFALVLLGILVIAYFIAKALASYNFFLLLTAEIIYFLIILFIVTRV